VTPECSFKLRRASLEDRLPPALAPWELKYTVTSRYSHGCQLTNWWSESDQHPARLPSTTSKVSTNRARWWPKMASPVSFDHCLRVPFQVHLIAAYKLARLQPPSSHFHGLPSGSPYSFNHGLRLLMILATQARDHTRAITASKCISESTWSSSSGAPRIALNNCLQPVQIYDVWMGSYIDT